MIILPFIAFDVYLMMLLVLSFIYTLNEIKSTYVSNYGHVLSGFDLKFVVAHETNVLLFFTKDCFFWKNWSCGRVCCLSLLNCKQCCVMFYFYYTIDLYVGCYL